MINCLKRSWEVLTPIFIAFLWISCSEGNKATMFSLLTSEETGVNFNNVIQESNSINIVSLEYLYNGAGVAAADFNNDSLTDIFFGGNRVSNKLFLNRGNMKFEDVSEAAKVADTSKWRSGVAVVDINGDGLLDIYQCATISKDSMRRANILFVNQGLDINGVPTFLDEASKYGIADTGHSSNAAFFDYDNDEDLDLYVLTNVIESTVPTTYHPKITDGSALNTDRLYRNNGNGTFTNVSKAAGIVFEGYGLGLAISDINQDGWQDIYVSNDYVSNDLLYINNRNGTFTNRIDEFIRHQSQFSMGNDIADINNDGLPDIVTLDMLPEGNLRRKTVIGGVSYTSYINNKQYHYAPQYIRNMLQLNNGNGTFSEVGQMAGIHQTEWSWSPLLADFDNDGLKDLLVTNGFPKDITDKDFGNFRNGASGAVASSKFLSDMIPEVKVPNRAFKNIDGLGFQDVNRAWGMNTPSFSSGAAYADFDNDGDLDYVVNNINDNAFIYRNNLYMPGKNKTTHFLRLKFDGTSQNRIGLGAKVWVIIKGKGIQYFEHSIYRGYVSCVEDAIHVGIAESTKIDSLIVQWPDGRIQKLTNVTADQTLMLKISDANSSLSSIQKKDNPIFENITHQIGLDFKHEEKDKIDFNIQRTIPHKFSQLGPGLAVADVDGDGLDDLFMCASSGEPERLFLQQLNGKFLSKDSFKEKPEEDEGALFFDADNDGDVDLYISSGGFEYEPLSSYYQDRLYFNDGVGNFSIKEKSLPKMTGNKSCVRASDYDRDGDLDLFIGGRVITGKYPLASPSYVLNNSNGIFSDVTEMVAPGLKEAGMISDALWSDFNNDGFVDLVVVGEFMSIQFYGNINGKFKKVESGLDPYPGWWNSIIGADFDYDGDTDYIAGNLGLNNYYGVMEQLPLKVYAKDFDGNGSMDALLTCYFKSEKGEMMEYPVNFWDELNTQSPLFRRKFQSYHQYGETTFKQLFNDNEIKDCLQLKANYLSTSYIKNIGNNRFEITPLPRIAQVAPVNGLVASDVDRDGFIDVLLIGNDYGNEVFSGRYDAFIGMMLKGDGKGHFEVAPTNCGFKVDKDAKALVKLMTPNGELYIASQNGDSLKAFHSTTLNDEIVLKPKALDSSIEIFYQDGRTQKTEFYYGSGYLSQSTRSLIIPVKSKEVFMLDSKGVRRRLTDRTIH